MKWIGKANPFNVFILFIVIFTIHSVKFRYIIPVLNPDGYEYTFDIDGVGSLKK